MPLNRIGIAAFKKLDRYDWILFTSKNTVHFFVKELRLRKLQLPIRIQIGAVGPETAEELKQAGIIADLIPKKFSAEHLAAALAKKLGKHAAGKRILFPRSALANADSVRMLRAYNIHVDVANLYTGTPAIVPKKTWDLLKKGEVSYVVFTSSSSVAAFAKKSQSLNRNTQSISAVCIGPSTAAAARAVTFKKIHIAEISTKAGIRDLLSRLP